MCVPLGRYLGDINKLGTEWAVQLSVAKDDNDDIPLGRMGTVPPCHHEEPPVHCGGCRRLVATAQCCLVQP